MSDIIELLLKKAEDRAENVKGFLLKYNDLPFFWKTKQGITLFLHRSSKIDAINQGYPWQLSILGSDGIPNGDTRYKNYSFAVKDAVREWNIDLNHVDFNKKG